MLANLTGKTAFITGSTHGVGFAIAEGLARCGADLVLHGLVENEAARTAKTVLSKNGNRVDVVYGDLAASSAVGFESICIDALNKNPSIDLLVCNAGTYIDTPFLEMDYDRFDRTMRLNVYSYFFVSQFFAKKWVEKNREGRIVLVGSINGRLAEDVHVAYDSSKGAVESMVRSMAVSLGRKKIRVNGMAPGLVYTPLTAPALDQPEFMEWMKWHTPNGQVPGPEACASTVAFLLSDEAWHVTGQMILVDGGMSAWQQPDPPPKK